MSERNLSLGGAARRGRLPHPAVATSGGRVAARHPTQRRSYHCEKKRSHSHAQSRQATLGRGDWNARTVILEIHRGTPRSRICL